MPMVNYHPMAMVCRIEPAPESRSVSVADVELDGGLIRISPKAEGSTSFTLVAQSNGKVASRTIPVTVAKTTGIDSFTTDVRSVTAAGGVITIKGCEGYEFEIVSAAGVSVSAFSCGSSVETVRPVVPRGIYVVRGFNGTDTITAKVAL